MLQRQVTAPPTDQEAGEEETTHIWSYVHTLKATKNLIYGSIGGKTSRQIHAHICMQAHTQKRYLHACTHKKFTFSILSICIGLTNAEHMENQLTELNGIFFLCIAGVQSRWTNVGI